ncbi:MAG: hypothetical protein ACLP1Y_14435 [Candidatus Acidiferrales bacterium]
MSSTSRPSTAVETPSKPGGSRGDKSWRWEEARLLYPTYVALSKKFDLAAPPCGDGELPEVAPSVEAVRQVAYWLEGLDQQIRPHQFRQLFSGSFKVQEEPLRALIGHHLEKHSVAADRDKLDFLLAQYFALSAPTVMLSKTLTLEDVAEVLEPVLGEARVPPLSWYEPLDSILRALPGLHSLRDLFESGYIEKGRLLKESARSKGYHPSAELAFCHFNFLMRRAFIRLMHEDVRALRENLAQLSAAGVATLDCRRAGMSAEEPTEKLVTLCQEWKPPLHLDYTQPTTAGSLEQLLALRTDVEEALEKHVAAHRIEPEKSTRVARKQEPPELFGVPIALPVVEAPAKKRVAGDTVSATKAVASPTAAPVPVKTAAGAKESTSRTPAAADREETKSPEKKAQAKEAAISSAQTAAKAAPANVQREPVTAPSQTEQENCLERIWEQLISAPPARGRSMATIALDGSRFLISSWEVAAFVSESGPFSEDFRRAVVARAMISTARDACRNSGGTEALQSALMLARNEINYLQGRAEQAKRAKDTETAVNLGITVKRLLSSIEEGEKLA